MSQRMGKKKRSIVEQTAQPPLPPPVAPTEKPLPSGGFILTPAVHVFLIVIVGLAIYASVLGAPFVFDDNGCILENPAITDIHSLFDRSALKSLALDEDLYMNAILRPVTYFTFAVNYALHGLDVRGYHVANLLIHLANALLVYRLTLLATRTPFFRRPGNEDRLLLPPVLAAFFTALFFVGHPLQIQAVTYITQRFASLATLFYLLSLTLYVQARLAEKATVRYLAYAGALLGALLAMKSKEIAFTLPVMIALFEVMFLNGSLAQRTLRLAPFLLTMLIIPVTVMGLSAETAPGRTSLGNSMELVNYGQSSKLDYLLTQFRAIVTYLRLLILPVGQNIDHDYSLSTSFFDPRVLLSFTLLAALMGAGFYLLHRSRSTDAPRRHWLRLTAFGIFWFFVTISVESSIIPLEDLLVEQRVYLPSVGFFLVCIGGVECIGAGLGGRLSGNRLVAALALVALALSVVAAVRNTVWRDPLTLWQDAARKSPNKARPHNNLGVHYYKLGLLAEGLRELQASLRIDPDNLEARHNVANIYLQLGRHDEAESEYRSLLRLNPDNEKVHNNLGHLLHLKRDYGNALIEFQRALAINPYFLNARVNRAELYEDLGQTDNAAKEYEAALKLDPANSSIRARLENIRGR